MVWQVLEAPTLDRSPMETGKISFAIDEQEQIPEHCTTRLILCESSSQPESNSERRLGIQGKLGPNAIATFSCSSVSVSRYMDTFGSLSSRMP